MTGEPNGGRRGSPSPSGFFHAVPLAWRVIVDGALPGQVNMARDHALALSVNEGTGVLRLYQWDPATISFGRNEPSRGLYSKSRAEDEGVAFVRRPTGGRAVLHHQELTYALVFPLGTFGGLKKAYRIINKGLLAGLQSMGVSVDLAAGTGPALSPDAGPCFRQPAEGEVMALGRKLIGSAQVRMGDNILQHGSIILDGDQDVLRRLRGDHEPVPPPATVKALMGVTPELPVMEACVREGLAHTLGGLWEEGDYGEDEKMAAGELESHYGDEDWTWRF